MPASTLSDDDKARLLAEKVQAAQWALRQYVNGLDLKIAFTTVNVGSHVTDDEIAAAAAGAVNAINDAESAFKPSGGTT